MTLHERVQEDMKSAMRSGEKERLATIRLILAAIKQREVDERITLDDVQCPLRHREDGQAEQGIHRAVRGRRVAPTWSPRKMPNWSILQAYLPTQLGEAEVDALIASAIAATGATSIKDMGKVVGIVKAKAAGKADMAAVSARVKAKLGG